MKRETRNDTIKELKTKGFKLVKDYNSLYINENGNVYSLKHGRYLKPTAKNLIIIENVYLNVSKLVLQAFKGEPYRSGQIHYIDGDKANVSRENVKYSSLFNTDILVIVNTTDLMTAIRCYFEVDKSFSILDAFKTRMYLQTITEITGFIRFNQSKPHIEVYKTYIGVLLFGLKSIAQTAKQHGLSIRDCTIIVNSFSNELINGILKDLKAGTLKEHPYKPKKPTLTEQKRHVNEYLTANGQTPIPLRKKSVKERLKEFNNLLIEINKEK